MQGYEVAHAELWVARQVGGIPCWLPEACAGRLDTTAALYCVRLWLTMRVRVLRSLLATAFPP